VTPKASPSASCESPRSRRFSAILCPIVITDHSFLGPA
jgi:hypothetical protein